RGSRPQGRRRRRHHRRAWFRIPVYLLGTGEFVIWHVAHRRAPDGIRAYRHRDGVVPKTALETARPHGTACLADGSAGGERNRVFHVCDTSRAAVGCIGYLGAVSGQHSGASGDFLARTGARLAGCGPRARGGLGDDGRGRLTAHTSSITNCTLSAITRVATTAAAAVVTGWLAKPAIKDSRDVNQINGIKANGMPADSTTCDNTSALLASTPSARINSAGSTVTARRTSMGIRRF